MPKVKVKAKTAGGIGCRGEKLLPGRAYCSGAGSMPVVLQDCQMHDAGEAAVGLPSPRSAPGMRR